MQEFFFLTFSDKNLLHKVFFTLLSFTCSILLFMSVVHLPSYVTHESRYLNFWAAPGGPFLWYLHFFISFKLRPNYFLYTSDCLESYKQPSNSRLWLECTLDHATYFLLFLVRPSSDVFCYGFLMVLFFLIEDIPSLH